MDFFLHYRNPSFYSSSVAITNNKTSNSFHGKELEKKRNKRTSNNKITTKMKLSTDPQSVAARERRHRISEKFKILRSMIPGGNTKNMDTVSMLEEAIQYLKYLKSQIWLHQNMISFENFDDYDDASRNFNHLDHYPHQDFQPFDHFYGEYHLNEMLPHEVGFAEGSSLKVEGEDNMVYLSHDHHHHQHHHAIYP